MRGRLLAPAPHVGIGSRLRHQLGHDLAQLGRVPAVALVLTGSGHPTLGDADVPAHDVEDAARDVPGLAAAELLTGSRLPKPVETAPSLYWEIVKHSWVFGIWSIFGWFSGLGSSLLLTRVTNSTEIARYAQIVAISSALGLMTGALTTAALSKLLARGAEWDEVIDRTLDRVCNLGLILSAALLCLCQAGHLEQASIIRHLVPLCPPYIWLYLFVVYASYTIYQRALIYYQYERSSSLSWSGVLCNESLGLAGFVFFLAHFPDRPLWAQAALMVGRCAFLFVLSAKCRVGSFPKKYGMLTLASALGVCICLLFRS